MRKNADSTRIFRADCRLHLHIGPAQMQLASEYADARSEQKRAALQTAAEREFKQQCPFTPRVSRVSRQIVANMRAAALAAAAHASAAAEGGADADAAFAFGIGDAAAGMNAAQV
jgi:hypothetical protein